VPDLPTLVAFSLVTLALVATPGPGLLYVIARSFDQGRRAGLASMLGIESAELIYIAVAAAGLSALLAASAAAMEIVRYVGAAYLIALGIRHWRRAADPDDALAGSDRLLFAHGFVIQMLNPKVAFFFVAYFPQFVTADSAAAPQFLLLGGFYIAIACLSDGVFVLLASRAGRYLARHTRARRRIGRASAASYIGLGLFAAVAGDRSAVSART
jgi:threonine/homoserine/homoserine lactone efflux protein